MVTTYSYDGHTRDQAGAAFTITDWAEDFTLDCNTDVVAVTNNVLGTLIKELIQKGILTGSVATV